MSFNSSDGWAIEIARGDQNTDGEPHPKPSDLPADVRAAILSWLFADGTESEGYL